jgi:NADH-quinone oxidoreductase subunit E
MPKKKRPLSILPEGQEYGYDKAYKLAYRLAGEQLAQIKNVKAQCRQAGATYSQVKKTISLKYLNQSHSISLPDGEISLPDSEEPVPIREKILILHYLTSAKGTPSSNQMITYKELPGGANYFTSFSQRVIKPLLDHFGWEPYRLIEVAQKLGGVSTQYGDVAVTFKALPRVPVTLVLWRGDEEFPPRGSIVFDRAITDYLATEDVNVLCETIVWKLVKWLNNPAQSIKNRLGGILTRYSKDKSELIPLLQEVQEAFGYLPREAMQSVARFLRLPDSTVYGVATFYTQFKLEPGGRRRIIVCRGTACHACGGVRILSEVEKQLGINVGEIAVDRSSSLETIVCLGACSLAPVMAVDHRIYGRMKIAKVKPILSEEK